MMIHEEINYDQHEDEYAKFFKFLKPNLGQSNTNLHDSNNCYRNNCKDHIKEKINCSLCNVLFLKVNQQDHLEICPQNIVNCPNKYFGCHHKIKRHQISYHLLKCPANIVVCKSSWSRWITPIRYMQKINEKENKANEEKKSFCAKFSQLDVQLAIRDQKWLDLAEKLPKYFIDINTGVNNGTNNKSFPNVPLIYPKQFSLCNKETWVWKTNNIGCDMADAPWNKHRNPPGLLATITKNITENETINENNNVMMEKNNLKFTKHENEGLQTDDFIKLDLNVESYIDISNNRRAGSSCGRYFWCSKVFRRDEFPRHQEVIHNQLICGLNGWYQMRCPLSYLGCNWHAYRFNPINDDFQFSFDSNLDDFVVLPNEQKVQPTISKSITELHRHRTKEKTPILHLSNKYDGNVTANGLNSKVIERCNLSSSRESSPLNCDNLSLSDLPYDIIENICTFLDQSSIMQLSLTNTMFRTFVSNFVKKWGVVITNWKKGENGGWHISGFSWKFTTSISPINSWTFNPNTNLQSHLKTCKYYDCNKHDNVHVRYIENVKCLSKYFKFPRS